jgi:hypothetical protein
MKTKFLAIMLLAGGSMFAQTRFSVGIGLGGNGRGFYQPPPSYSSYQFVPRFDSRFNDSDDRRDSTGGFASDRNRGFDQGRNFAGQNRSQTRSFEQVQSRDFGQNQNQNQNQNRGNSSRSNGSDNRQENGRVNGFTGR